MTDPTSPPFRNKRRRRARPSLSRRAALKIEERAKKKQAKEARLLAAAEKRAAKEAAIVAAKTAETEKAKAQLAELADVQRELLRQARPKSVDEYCRMRGVDPDTVPYHPRYNIPGVPPELPVQWVENICFAKDWSAEYGGLGAYRHLENFIRITWPDVVWNDWMVRMLRSLTDSDYEVRLGDTRLRFVNWVGAGSSGKTFSAGMFASAWFMFDTFFGHNLSSVTLTSTSKSIIAQRVWPVIQKCYHEAKNADGTKMKWGHLVDSKKMVQLTKGDEKHSISALAVEPGDLQGALDKIKGRHTPRMLLVVDEANSTPQAIFECIPNMLTGIRELVVLVIGNAGSRLDPHGRCCEPKAGWKSITIDDDQWETKGVAQWGIGPGVCLHFDASRSPNVLAGRTEHRFIYSFERWQQVLHMGEEYRNTLQHWSQDRGFWPPDGLQTTVFTEALVVSHDGMGKFDWIDQPKPCAALDTAFGGDDCVYTPGLLGLVRGPKLALQLGEPILVPFDPESLESIDFQIAKWFIARCKKEGVAPELAGMDSTAIGRGVYAVVQQLWSPRVLSVEFGGAASDLPASLSDPRPSREVYANRVTELTYVLREMLIGGQLKGLHTRTVQELCSRTYEFISKRYKVEPKGDLKSRLGHSCDYADSAAVLGDVARRNGLKLEGISGAIRKPRVDTFTLNEGLNDQNDDYRQSAEFLQYADP